MTTISFSNYAGLKAAIITWLDRPDIVEEVAGFVALAESEICRRMKLRPTEVQAYITTDPGNAFLTYPPGYLQFRFMQVTPAEEGGRQRPIKYLSPQQFNALDELTVTGTPKYYTLHGDRVRLGPVPEGAFTIDVGYIKRALVLVNDEDTNEILQEFPGAYLYGSLVHAEPFLINDARVTTWRTMFEEIMGFAKRSDEEELYDGVPVMGHDYSVSERNK